ncbi:MAG: ABC transporter permease [Clostridia bacterium]|jgi:spermidine/putrescine transport system permease protein|nr:ABC transporter permease [Clostridia bacterium]MBO4861161.1 ABC transporter permease [Clostridia bacterium]MBO7400156.1 ABC transporter permease [Clostridia bacterium]MBP5237903.1 ABC transporter permease [Clostridia bacterium]MBP5657131.1 ABC transporter permease [Clostridia bacterium]
MNGTNRTWLQKYAASPYLVWCVIFVLAPLAFVIYYSLTDRNGNFGFANYARMFNGDTLHVFLISLAFAFVSTVICLIIAYPLAYFITKAKKKHQNMLLMLFMLPMWMNFVLRTYALSFLLEDTGLINSILKSIGFGQVKLIYTSGAVILGMVYNFLPYMLLPIYTVMSKIDKNLIEASEDLGCNRLMTIGKILLPLSIPGIVSGITMVFVPSVSTFYISQQLGPTDFMLIGDLIESEIKSTAGVYNYGSAISFVLMVLIFICIAVMNHFSDESVEGGMLV